MSEISTIEWTDSTWNPVTGCTKVGPGCDNCYAETIAERFRGTPGHPYEQGFDLKLWGGRMDIPKNWKKPRMIFVNSMSDLFHKEIPKYYIDEVFNTMEAADHHIYQVLTKRSSLMRDYLNERYCGDKEFDGFAGPIAPKHIWLGVSVEDRDHTSRIRHLQDAQAHIRFISFEPLLGPIGEVDLTGIHWAIVGGESGPRHRPMKEEWAIELRDQCKEQGVPFFFKQWGGIRPKSGGRELQGKIYDEYPEWA